MGISKKLHFAFDFDMTLADTREIENQAFRKLFEGYFSEEDHLQELLAGLGKGAKLKEILENTFPEDAIQEATHKFKIVFKELIHLIKPMYGSQELLQWLASEDVEVSIVSAKSQENLDLSMEVLGMGALSARGGLFGNEKCSRLREVKADVYVGDQISDVRAANLAGCASVLITSNVYSGNDRSSKPDLEFNNLIEFMESLLIDQSIEKSLHLLLGR